MTTLKTGLRRLLKLADILDVADALHRKRKEPTYNQERFAHPSCGTPACALGHYATHSRRWKLKRVEVGPNDVALWPLLKQGSGDSFTDANEEFALDVYANESQELFGAMGCGEAQTAKQAARYIRRFVKRKERESSRAAA